MRQGTEWAITKSGVPPAVKRSGKSGYENHDRAVTVYNHYISGFTEEEILVFLQSTGVEGTLADVEMDLQYIKSLHPTRTLIAHENDRNRLLLQRTEGAQYRQLLADSLRIKATAYLAAGISPTGPMKEFREAVGMTEKPGAINVSVNNQSLNIGGGESRQQSGIRSSEDLLRAVMDKMSAAEHGSLPPVEDKVIEAEAVTVEESAPAEDIGYEDEDVDYIPGPDD